MKPCKECIVSAMCKKACPDLIKLIPEIMKSYNIYVARNNYVNKDVFRYLAENMRENKYSETFHFHCVGLNNDVMMLYTTQKNGEIINMRTENE